MGLSKVHIVFSLSLSPSLLSMFLYEFSLYDAYSTTFHYIVHIFLFENSYYIFFLEIVLYFFFENSYYTYGAYDTTFHCIVHMVRVLKKKVLF